MIKRLSLSLQIAIIFLIAFTITYFLAVYIILGSLDNVFESNIFEQLESKSREYSMVYYNDNLDINPTFAYISYSVESNEYTASNNIDNYVNNELKKLLFNRAAAQDNSISRYKNIIGGREIYYVILHTEFQSNDTFILITDEALKDDMRKSMSNQILLACMFAYLLGYLLIFVWNSSLVHDTKKIAQTLHETGKDYYRKKVTTTRQDEIGDLVYNIELMREKIVNSEKHKQEIIQGVSHHLNTPIAIIRSYAEALQDGIYSSKDVSQITLKQCDRLNSKVKKLLTLTRIGYLGANSTDLGEINIENLVLDIANDYASQSAVQIKLNTQPATFKGDRESWQIVIENLLDNAVRYAKTQIKITLVPNGLIIFNDGDHIKSEDLNSIFNAYVKGKDGNYGLGLSIVKNAVNLFGYDVSAQNTEDGVAFTIK